jgi:hypothetical protein
MAAQGLPGFWPFTRINKTTSTQCLLGGLTLVVNLTYSSKTPLDAPSLGLCTTGPSYGSTMINISGYLPNNSQAIRSKRLSPLDGSGPVGNGSCWSGKFGPFH